jgi:prefoldin subunit 4
MPLPRALKRLENDRSDLDARISALSASSDDCETKMKELKVALYAKFGRAINLDE